MAVDTSGPFNLIMGVDGSASGRAARTRPAHTKGRGKISADAFVSPQLSLFQKFLCNTTDERDQLSNTVDLWDSVPRYSVSRQAMNKLRSAHGNLKLLKISFNYRARQFRAEIQPARIELPDADGNLAELDFYPSANEELVEDALRKIASDQQQGYYDPTLRSSGVVFSLHKLREELKRRGHSRSLQEIKLSLNILTKSIIDIISTDGAIERIGRSAYLPAMVAVTRKDLEADADARCSTQFHPLVTQSIDRLTYRQYNYHQMMGHSTQLARWLHKQIAIKFTFAAIGKAFEMRFSTIERDSALFNGYAEENRRLAVKATDDAFEELRKKKLLLSVDRKVVRGERNKVVDVVYTLWPSIEFVGAMKAANKRQKLAGGAESDPLQLPL